jgi:type II secretory pathway component PulK
MNKNATHGGANQVRRYRSGSALLVVLIMLGTIAVLAVIVARSVSTAAIELGTARATALSEADLHAGIEIGVAAILQLGDNMRSADAGGNLNNRRITVHITNERARIDINQAPESILQALFAAQGINDNDAAELASAVSEWRGGSASQKLVSSPQIEGFRSSLPGLTTFETPTDDSRTVPKQSIGVRYFFHPTQLVSVPGFSKPLVNAILPSVTVANGSKQIDPYIAPRAVLEALPGTSPDQVQAFIESRDGDSTRDMALLMLGADKSFLTDTAAPGWRLEITSLSANRRLRREVVIAVTKGDSPPFRVLYVGDQYPVASNE